MASAVRKPLSASSVAGRGKDPTRALSWAAFMKQHPRAHLLTGVCDDKEALASKRPGSTTLLKQLALAICCRGEYAVTTLQSIESGHFTMVAIESRQDADRLSKKVGARIAPRFGNWRSHRSFNLDVNSYGRIATYLATAVNSSR